MRLIALPHGRLGRRTAFAGFAVAVAASLSVATVLNPQLSTRVGEAVGEGIGAVKTVAAMLAERSPGERPEGALANLKPKHRSAAVHERALPKIRGPESPLYQALTAVPPAVAPPAEVPLHTALAGGPPETIPPVGGVFAGGPPVLSTIPPAGGGGGGAFVPPIVTTATPEVPVTPVVQVTPLEAVPEPASWVMMLLGFTLMGWTLRRSDAAGSKPARD